MRGHKRSLLLALLLCCIGVIAMAGIYRREKTDDSAETIDADASKVSAAGTDAPAETDVSANEDSFDEDSFDEDSLDEDFSDENSAAKSPAEENSSDESSGADSSGDWQASEDSSEESDAANRQAEEALSGTVASDLNFQSDSVLTWPVQGELLMEFSMEQPVYFATLAQYKLCPGILIRAEEGDIVYAGADACVTAVGQSDELGATVTLDLGNGYTALYGQLKAVNVSEGDMVSAGAALGLVAAPTKYYCVEGDHVYLQLEKDGTPIDPLDYLD